MWQSLPASTFVLIYPRGLQAAAYRPRRHCPAFTHTRLTTLTLPYMTADILKFYGCELGAQTNFDKTTGTSIVNGAHDQKKLCELLEDFIKK